VSLAAMVISLTFQANIYLHLSRDELVLKRRVFDEHSAQSKAVLDDSLITQWTPLHLIKGLAKKSH